MHKIFSFRGMTHGRDPLLTSDGECIELMNLRSCNGTFRPIPEPRTLCVLPAGYAHIMWHSAAGYYICVTDDHDAAMHFYDKDWKPLLCEDGSVLSFSSLLGVNAVETIGNIVCCLTARGVRYIVYSEGSYRWLGESPPVPRMDVSLESKLQVMTTEESYVDSTFNDDFESSWRYNSKGVVDECIYYLNHSGFYIDRALFRFALRLYDGSYIYCSNVMYVSDNELVDYVGRDSNNFYSVKSGYGELAPYTVKVKGFKPKFSFSSLGLEAWNGIVVGIDVFTTGSIMGHKADTMIARLHDRDTQKVLQKNYEGYALKSLEELWDDVVSASLFYKIAEYDIYGNSISEVTDVSHTNLQLQQGLDYLSVPASCSSFAAECSYTLNNRLHVASLCETLYAGYDTSMLEPIDGEKLTVSLAAVETKIRKNDGVATVVKRYENVALAYANGVAELSPLLMYPDSRAYEMTVYLMLENEVYVKSFPLLPHKYLNCAQYLHRGGRMLAVDVESFFKSGFVAASVKDEDVLMLFSHKPGEYEVVYSATDECWKYQGRKFPPDEFSALRVFAIPREIADGDKIVFTIYVEQEESGFVDICNIPVDSTWLHNVSIIPAEKRDVEERSSILKVSATDNPFLFPAKCTYSPSQTRILAMASNTMELSQGRFGEHPLFVFCQDGIWVMSIDVSGTVAYSGCNAFSREVCINVRSVYGIGHGVVFVGQRGLMLISGNKIKELSSQLRFASSTARILLENTSFEHLTSFFESGLFAGTGEFDEFAASCSVAYDAVHGELVLYDGKYEGCYVYSLKDELWSRTSFGLSGFVSGGFLQEMFVNVDGCTAILLPGDEKAGSNRVMMFTHPQLFGSKQPKRLKQLVLHAYASLPGSWVPEVPVLGCYVFCSNDGIHFKLLTGKEFHGEVQDLRFPFFPTSSYRYYLFVVVGEMGADSMLTGIETEISLAWNSRIR